MFSDFEEYTSEVIFPDMLVKLKQGAGRLIRSETDTGVISILDWRVNGFYKNDVLQALSNCVNTNCIEDIKKFIKEKKRGSHNNCIIANSVQKKQGISISTECLALTNII